jgi:hypothetical protein
LRASLTKSSFKLENVSGARRSALSWNKSRTHTFSASAPG